MMKSLYAILLVWVTLRGLISTSYENNLERPELLRKMGKTY